jgi:hypothetical protein
MDAAADDSRFLGLPGDVWPRVLLVIAAGVLVLVAVCVLKKKNRLKFAHELARDIGIALIVAGIVSWLYEFSTRSVENARTLSEMFDAQMRHSIPPTAWEEVKGQIVAPHAIRRNVAVHIEVSHQAALLNGTLVPPPACQSVLDMTYSYDLYATGQESIAFRMEQVLDYDPMWSQQLQLPRFDRLRIAGPGVSINARNTEELQQYVSGPGRITAHFRLWPLESKKPVHVETERHELVSTPGSYYLVVRELTANDPQSGTPTFEISMTLPADLEARVQTYYAAHEFKRDGTKNRWTFDGIMLPGQGVDMLFAVAPGARHVP